MEQGPLFSEEHERSLVGCYLQHPEILNSSAAIAIESLYLPNLRSIYRIQLELNNQGLPADQIGVIAAMTENGTLVKVGGADFVIGVSGEACFKSQAEAYKQKVQQDSVKRRIRERWLSFDFEAGSLTEVQQTIDELRELAAPDAPNAGTDKGLSTIMPEPIDICLMDKTEEERPVDIISGILPVETVMLLYGVPKVGKSLMALNLAFNLASGQPWFNLEIKKPWKVLYISAEGGKWALYSRIKHLKKGKVRVAAKQFAFWAVPSFDVLNETDFAALERAVEGFGPDIVILDPLQKLHQTEENDNTGMQLVLDRLRSLITGQGRSLIIVHHARKSGDASRGASSIAGEVDSIIRLEWESKDNHHGARRLLFEDLRHGEAPDDLYLYLDPNSLSFTQEGCSSPNEAVQVLADNDGRMKSRTALRNTLIASSGYKEAWAYKRIQLAIQSGLIEEATKGGEIRLRSL